MRQNLIDITGLSLGFTNGKTENIIFRGIEASARAGEMIAIIGSNGRGKSTLLKTLTGIQEIFVPQNTRNGGGPEQGQIFYNGKEMSHYTHKELSQLIAFVSSRTERARNLTVKDMLGIHCYYKTNWLGTIQEEDSRKIADALDMVGLSGFEERDSSALSDGEYQRATIAAAIVQDPDILLLDEPTAFLDIANRFTITRLLKDIAHTTGKLVLFSTHDLQLAIDMCDKIWLMASDGFYCDTPPALMDAGVFDKIFVNSHMHFNRNTHSFELQTPVPAVAPHG